MNKIKDENQPLWWIPLTYTTSKKLNFSSTKPIAWIKAEKTISLQNLGAKKDEWIIFNILETGIFLNVARFNHSITLSSSNVSEVLQFIKINGLSRLLPRQLR